MSLNDDNYIKGGYCWIFGVIRWKECVYFLCCSYLEKRIKVIHIFLFIIITYFFLDKHWIQQIQSLNCAVGDKIQFDLNCWVKFNWDVQWNVTNSEYTIENMGLTSNCLDNNICILLIKQRIINENSLLLSWSTLFSFFHEVAHSFLIKFNKIMDKKRELSPDEWSYLTKYFVGNNNRFRENIIIPRTLGPVTIKTNEEKMMESFLESCPFKSMMSCVIGTLYCTFNRFVSYNLTCLCRLRFGCSHRSLFV